MAAAVAAAMPSNSAFPELRPAVEEVLAPLLDGHASAPSAETCSSLNSATT